MIDEDEIDNNPVMQTLQWARRNGYKPVLLRPRDKAALNREYVSTTYVPPDDSRWFLTSGNVGIVTGPLQQGPIDIDLDCDEAMFFATIFLPPTPAIFGRASKPKSHYIYNVAEPTFEKQAFLDPVTGETMLELRGDGGHQTVFPGSIHPGGERIEWHNGIIPIVPKEPSEALTKAARKIALATLCSRYVWSDGYHNEATKHLSGMFYYLDWTEDEAVHFIETLMTQSGDTDKSRIPTVRGTYKRAKQGKKITGSGVLRKHLRDDALMDRMLELAGSNSINFIQEYNDRYAVGLVGGKFRVALIPENGTQYLEFVATDDFEKMQAVDTVLIDNKPVPKAKLWMNNPRRSTFSRVAFLPGVTEPPPDTLNIWSGWAVPPGEGECDGWLELLHTVIANNKPEGDWLEGWFADILKNPCSKPGTSPVMTGNQGAGKTLLISYFGKILGNAYVAVTNETHLYGRFNAHLATCLLLHSEEAWFSGDRKHRGIIKSMITDRHTLFEMKGIDARSMDNYSRVILTSNDPNAAPAEAGDRRFTIFDLGGIKPRMISEKLMNKVLAEMESTGPQALHAHLLNVDTSKVRHNIRNASLEAVKLQNLDPVAAWWLDVLQRGSLLPDALNWCQKPDKVAWPHTVSTQALAASFYVSPQRPGFRPGIEYITQFLFGRLLQLEFKPTRVIYENPLSGEMPRQEYKDLPVRQRSFVGMPTLDQCREAFSLFLGQPVNWNDQPDIELAVVHPKPERKPTDY